MKNQQKMCCKESYIKAFNKLEQLKDADKFPGWMSRIVANMAIDVLREKKRNNNKLFSEMESDDSEDMTFEEKNRGLQTR